MKKKILFLLLFISFDCISQRNSDSSFKIFKLKDCISISESGSISIKGDTINAIRILYNQQLDGWEESKKWQERYYYLIENIDSLK